TTHSSSSSYQPPNRVTSNVYTRLPVHAQSLKCSNTAQPRRADTHSASTCAHASTPSTHASPALSSAGSDTCLTRRVGTPSTAPPATNMSPGASTGAAGPPGAEGGFDDDGTTVRVAESASGGPSCRPVTAWSARSS